MCVLNELITDKNVAVINLDWTLMEVTLVALITFVTEELHEVKYKFSQQTEKQWF